MDGKFWAKVGLGCLLLLLISVFVQAIGAFSIAQWSRPTIITSDETQELLKQVHLTRFGVRLNKKANLVDAIFSFENTSEQSVTNIDIICEIFDKNGRYLGNRKWLTNEPVKMSSTKTFFLEDSKMFIPLQAHKVECKIASMEVVHEPLITVKRSQNHLVGNDTKSHHSSVNNH